MVKPKLLPCPFCGGISELIEIGTNYNNCAAVECKSCGANTGPADTSWMEHDQVKKAIAKWNRRSDDSRNKLADMFGPSPTGVEPKRKRKK